MNFSFHLNAGCCHTLVTTEPLYSGNGKVCLLFSMRVKIINWNTIPVDSALSHSLSPWLYLISSTVHWKFVKGVDPGLWSHCHKFFLKKRNDMVLMMTWTPCVRQRQMQGWLWNLHFGKVTGRWCLTRGRGDLGRNTQRKGNRAHQSRDAT